MPAAAESALSTSGLMLVLASKLLLRSGSGLVIRALFSPVWFYQLDRVSIKIFHDSPAPPTQNLSGLETTFAPVSANESTSESTSPTENPMRVHTVGSCFGDSG